MRFIPAKGGRFGPPEYRFIPLRRGCGGRDLDLWANQLSTGGKQYLLLWIHDAIDFGDGIAAFHFTPDSDHPCSPVPDGVFSVDNLSVHHRRSFEARAGDGSCLYCVRAGYRLPALLAIQVEW